MASVALMLLAVVCTRPRLHKRITPAAANLALSSFVPIVGVGIGVTPAAANLILNGAAPTMSTGNNILISPAAANLILSTFAPNQIPDESWTQVASWTHSGNIATVDFTGLSGTEFLVILRAVALTGAGSRRLRVSDDNGSTWVDGATDYQDIDNLGVEADHDGPSLNSAIATTASDAALHIVGANLSAPPKMLERRTRTSFQECVSTPVGVINAIRIYATVGDFSAGTIRVYAR